MARHALKSDPAHTRRHGTVRRTRHTELLSGLLTIALLVFDEEPLAEASKSGPGFEVGDGVYEEPPLHVT